MLFVVKLEGLLTHHRLERVFCVREGRDFELHFWLLFWCLPGACRANAASCHSQCYWRRTGFARLGSGADSRQNTARSAARTVSGWRRARCLMNRRTWLRVSGATAAAAALPFLFQRRVGHAEPSSKLVRDPRRILDLRAGLEYRVLERAFDPMTDGHRVPAAPDGMACFAGPNNTWVLMRNHELDYNLSLGAFRGKPVPEAYDARAAGGVTRVVLDAATGERLSSNLVLAGTLRNCAGGPSPWGWISCEETTVQNH